MAINIPQEPFSGGAVVFNHQPYLNLYANVLARRQAKQDALEQYYQKALTEVTPTGMRGKDITGGWNKKLQDWQNFAMENKKYLLNPKLDGYKALTEFNNRHADLMADVQKSKEAAQHEKDIYQLLKSGKWSPTGELDEKTGRFEPGSDMDIKERISKSIYDPSRFDEQGNEPDVSQFSINAPDLTPQQLLTFQKNIEYGYKRGEQPLGTAVRNKTTGKIEQQVQDVFTSDQLKNMADKMGDVVRSNKSLNKFYNNMLHSGDLEHLTQLNDAYKSVYPNGMMDTPEEVAKAETILLKRTPSNVRTKSMPDVYLQDELSRGRIALRDYYAKQRIDQRYERDVRNILASDTNFDEIWKTVGTNLPENLVKKVYGTPKDEKGHTLPQPEVTLSPDGQTYNFTVYTDGKPDPNYSKSVPAAVVKTQMKQDLASAIKTKTTLPSKTDQKYSDVTSGTFKGKRVQIGMKNGKWYNIQTGEEIK